MKNKIVIFNIVIVTLALLIVFFSGISLIKKSHLEEAEKQVVTVTDVYAANYSDNITATSIVLKRHIIFIPNRNIPVNFVQQLIFPRK